MDSDWPVVKCCTSAVNSEIHPAMKCPGCKPPITGMLEFPTHVSIHTIINRLINHQTQTLLLLTLLFTAQRRQNTIVRDVRRLFTTHIIRYIPYIFFHSSENTHRSFFSHLELYSFKGHGADLVTTSFSTSFQSPKAASIIRPYQHTWDILGTTDFLTREFGVTTSERQCIPPKSRPQRLESQCTPTTSGHRDR